MHRPIIRCVYFLFQKKQSHMSHFLIFLSPKIKVILWNEKKIEMDCKIWSYLCSWINFN